MNLIQIGYLRCAWAMKRSSNQARKLLNDGRDKARIEAVKENGGSAVSAIPWRNRKDMTAMGAQTAPKSASFCGTHKQIDDRQRVIDGLTVEACTESGAFQ